MQLSTTKDIFVNLQILKKFNKQQSIDKMRNLEDIICIVFYNFAVILIKLQK